jgi:hypothetical protein
VAWLRRGLDENMRAAGLAPLPIGILLLFGYFGLFNLVDAETVDGRMDVAFVVYCLGLWLLPWAYSGRAISLRHDIAALDVVRVAEIFGETVPTHPVWWREMAGRHLPLWVPVLVTTVAIPASLITWLGPVVALSGGLFSYLRRADRRQQRAADFRAAVYARVGGPGVAGLQSDRERLLVEITTLQAQLDNRQNELEALDREAGLAGVAVDRMNSVLRHLVTSESRSRRWDILLVAVSFILGLLAHTLFGT